MVSRNDASPSDGDDKRLARVRGEQYPEHIKGSLVDLEKSMLMPLQGLLFPIHYK